MSQIGFFGKLPGYGDFVERNLPRSFVETWDQWLQQGLSASRQMLGDQWLDHYLTAPVWRFGLSSGCVDSQSWIGVVLPSVDRVGRYFPLTLAAPLADDQAVSVALGNNSEWFRRLEDIAIACLEESPTVDAVVEVLDALGVAQQQGPVIGPIQTPFVGFCVPTPQSDMQHSESDMLLTQSLTLNEALLRQQFPSYSLWHSVGTENTAGMLLSTGALPNPHGVTAMITGQWREYGWDLLG